MAELENLKKLVLMIAGLAAMKWGAKVEEEQEVLAVAADILIDIYAAESALLRSRRLGGGVYADMARLYQYQAVDRAQAGALSVLPRLAEGDELRGMVSAARRLTKHEPQDLVELRRRIAEKVLERDGYPQPRA